MKFSNGLLAKMSKITDLISKLEGLEGISSDDKGRANKSEPHFLQLLNLKRNPYRKPCGTDMPAFWKNTQIYLHHTHIYITDIVYIYINDQHIYIYSMPCPPKAAKVGVLYGVEDAGCPGSI
jgi:hypothetical protein